MLVTSSTKKALYSGINNIVAEHAMFSGKKHMAHGNNIYSRLQVLRCIITQQLTIIAFHQHVVVREVTRPSFS